MNYCISCCCLLLVLLECRSLGPLGEPRRAEFAYLYPTEDGLRALSLCVCAKCGSHTLFQTLHKGFVGHYYTREGPPWVHEFMKWNITHVVRRRDIPPNTPITNVIIIRDPVERYLSTYHYIIKCCNASSYHPCYNTRQPGYTTGIAPILPNILHWYDIDSDVQCLHFNEFVTYIKMVANDPYANQHVRSQRFTCPFVQHADNIVTSIQDVARRVNALGIPSFPVLDENPRRWHSRARTPDEGVTDALLHQLHIISRADYNYFERRDHVKVI